MNIPQRPRPRQVRDFGTFRVDPSALDTQEVVVEMADRDTQEVAAVEIVDPDKTVKRRVVKRVEKTPPATITIFPTQSGVDSIRLPVTPIPLSIPDLPLSEVEPDYAIISILPTTPLPAFKEHQEQIIDYRQKSEAKQKTIKKKRISLAIRIGLTLLLFAVLFRSISWSTVLVILAHANPVVVLIGLIVGAFGIVISSYQWRSLLHSEQIHFDLAKLINLYMVGVAFSHFLPTGIGGDAIKAFYVGRDSNNNAGSASAVVMSRVTGFFSMLLVASPALIIWRGHFAHGIIIGFVLLSLTLGSLFGGAILSAALLPKLFKGRWAKHRYFALAIRIGNALSRSIRRPRSLGVAILFGILFHLVACLNYYTYAIVLGLNVPLYFYFVAIPLISLVAFLPISINGFGVRESTLVFVFSTIHVPIAISLLLALLMDAQVLFFGTIGGCIYLTMDSSQEKMIKKQHIA